MKKDRTEYMKEYKKNLSRTGIDLTKEERKKLDKIVETKNQTIIGWIREKINEDYKKI